MSRLLEVWVFKYILHEYLTNPQNPTCESATLSAGRENSWGYYMTAVQSNQYADCCEVWAQL